MNSKNQNFDALKVAKTVLEIEQKALIELSDSLDEEFVKIVNLVAGLKGRLICAGVGKSGHVARKIAATLASTGTNAQFIHPTEASHGDLGMISNDDAILILSKSGEAPELSDLLAYARRFGIPLIAMTANKTSLLGKSADYHMLLPNAPEACAETRAPTTSTTLQIAFGDCLAVALIEMRGFTANDFRNFHPGGKLGAMLKSVGDLMHDGEKVPKVKSKTLMREVLLEMTEKRLGMTTVIDENENLLGIITDGDIRRLIANQNFFDKTADEIMTKNPMTIAQDALAAEALAKLNATKRTVIIITEQDKPIGIIHIHDLLAAGVI